MLPLIATPVLNAKEFLSGKMLCHLTKIENLDKIVTSGEGESVKVHLRAGQGWSFSGRFARDYSVLDPFLNKHKAYGCYTYFFMGQPNWWARFKNFGLKAGRGDMDGLVVIEVRGEDVLACADLLFHRLDDNVLVIRGDYHGPATINRN